MTGAIVVEGRSDWFPQSLGEFICFHLLYPLLCVILYTANNSIMNTRLACVISDHLFKLRPHNLVAKNLRHPANQNMRMCVLYCWDLQGEGTGMWK